MNRWLSAAKKLPSDARTLASLEPGLRRLALEAWRLVFGTTVRQKFYPYAGWKEALTRALNGPSSADTTVDTEKLNRLLTAYRLGLHDQPFRPNCLQRSMALWRLLARHGIRSRLVIGTRLENGGLAGHAWVERNGRVLNDGADVGNCYTPLDPGNLPAAPRLFD